MRQSFFDPHRLESFDKLRLLFRMTARLQPEHLVLAVLFGFVLYAKEWYSVSLLLL
ncbi:hypothetical protein D3C79_893540 [compost metagenome]